MTRDYKNMTVPRAKEKAKTKKASKKKTIKKLSNVDQTSGLSARFILLSMIVILLFVSFLVYLKLNVGVDDDFSKFVKDKEVPEFSTKMDKNSDPVEEEKNRFEFYNILPKRNIEVPVGKSTEKSNIVEKNNVVEKKVVRQPLSENTLIKENVSDRLYLLQVGSFNRFKDADKRKAILAFMGVESRIHSVQKGNKTMYRVQVGPYDSLSKINKISSTLKQNNIQSLLMKVKG